MVVRSCDHTVVGDVPTEGDTDSQNGVWCVCCEGEDLVGHEVEHSGCIGDRQWGVDCVFDLGVGCCECRM